ncbi:MAG: response regulator transcription factor [Actinomycetota bacterium]
MTAVVHGGIVHIVDDDAAIRDALAWLLQSRGVEARAFESAEAFLAAWAPDMAGCLLLDIRMEGMSGLDLFQRLGELGSTLPVIFLTGHGDVPMAVTALKQGARDFVEKPFNDNELVDRIIAVLAWDAAQREARADADSVSARIGSLSERERQVMDLVLAGKLNKVIADELGISMRTVEVHRAHVFEKMGVRTAVDLARLLASGRPA